MLVEPTSEANQFATQVIGAAIEVHRHLGPGYLENIYEECLVIELAIRQISFTRQEAICIQYKGMTAGAARPDIIVGGALIVELKAVDSVLPIHKAQLMSYLKTTGITLGLLINFNTVMLRDGIERIVFGTGTNIC